MSKPEHDRTIDYIEFGATDIEATKRFYAACFGWKFTDYGPDYAAFEDGRLTGGFTTESKPGGAPARLRTPVVGNRVRPGFRAGTHAVSQVRFHRRRGIRWLREEPVQSVPAP